MHRCQPETEIALARGEGRALQKMKNRGNEAKKWLKKKDITFLNVAICACFACKLAPIAPQKEQKTPPQHEAGAITNSRLHMGHVAPAEAEGLRRIPPFAGMMSWVGSFFRQRQSNSTNEPGMSMKTKERFKNQPPLAPPYPRRGISWLIAEG